jgi:hypothetical protein
MGLKDFSKELELALIVQMKRRRLKLCVDTFMCELL